jgi:hypothetical protein
MLLRSRWGTFPSVQEQSYGRFEDHLYQSSSPPTAGLGNQGELRVCHWLLTIICALDQMHSGVQLRRLAKVATRIALNQESCSTCGFLMPTLPRDTRPESEPFPISCISCTARVANSISLELSMFLPLPPSLCKENGKIASVLGPFYHPCPKTANIREGPTSSAEIPPG